MDDTATIVKKTARVRKTSVKNIEEEQVLPQVQTTISDNLVKLFDEIASKISQSQLEYEKLQKEIIQTKQLWSKEQQDYQREREERNKQQELRNKQAEELYQYELSRKHKIAEDEFNDKKMEWERSLHEQKDFIEKERKELAELRVLSENFEKEKHKAVEEAEEVLRKQLISEFETDQKFKDGEIKAEKDILNLKLASLGEENKRLSSEVDTLKRAFDQATSQVKEIALKVIESRGNSAKPQPVSEN